MDITKRMNRLNRVKRGPKSDDERAVLNEDMRREDLMVDDYEPRSRRTEYGGDSEREYIELRTDDPKDEEKEREIKSIRDRLRRLRELRSER